MTDTYTAGLLELRKLKERLAELEQLAAQGPRAGMGDAIADHYSPTAAPVDPKARDLENAAKFFDPTAEAGFRQREKDPERYDRELAAMGGDLLAQSIALAGRAAHIELGGTIPDPEED